MRFFRFSVLVNPISRKTCTVTPLKSVKHELPPLKIPIRTSPSSAFKIV